MAPTATSSPMPCSSCPSGERRAGVGSRLLIPDS
jgi:hypothetical protein